MAQEGEHGNIHVINSTETWHAKVEESILHKKTIVVDFTATWCGPCRLIAPVFEELSKKYENLLFLQVDVDEFQEIAAEWEVRAMPTLLFIKDGKAVDKIVGANKEELERKAKEFAKESGHPESSAPAHYDHHKHHVPRIEA